MVNYLYLHGFASGPRSMKAQTLQAYFQDCGLTLHIPDLNQDDFTHLTLSRQIQQASQLIEAWDQVVIIGSSLGGLTATWIAEQPQIAPKIQRLVLLAPAFRFLEQWLPRLGHEQLRRWREEGMLPVYHYSSQTLQPLNYTFIRDAQKYDDDALQQPIPTLILHGRQDDVISIQSSQDYAAARPWVTLIELDSDHALANVQAEIWQAMQTFLAL